ncbi:MAG TPA: response regulator [Pyrinomonadaceae bacterium]|nr:response regulator [Pyrinomonadaceae bacterium]
MEAQRAMNYAQPQATILLVEDFDDTRLIMKLWLIKNGYRVVEAENGEEAVILAEQQHPDLIIMDMMMPGLNGLDATRRIREYQSLQTTPIVAVSAYGADEYRAKAIAAGCDEYVSTPFEPNELEALIKRLLAR